MMPDNKALMGLLITVIERLDSIDRYLTGTGDAIQRTWTPKDVERRFGIGERQQYNLRKCGALPYIQKTPGGPIRYLTPDVFGYFMSDDTPGSVAAGNSKETANDSK